MRPATSIVPKWGKKEDIKKLPKPDRISTATLYRNVDELKAGGFLEEVKGAERRGRSGTEVITYCLTFKGYLAEAINAHLLLLEGKTSPQLKETVERIVKQLDSSPGWPLFIDFLNWHREKGIDLTRINVDAAYFGSILCSALIEHPEHVWESLEPSVKQLGLDSLITKEGAVDLKNYYEGIRSFGDSFLAELTKERLKSRSQAKDAAKDRKSRSRKD